MQHWIINNTTELKLELGDILKVITNLFEQVPKEHWEKTEKIQPIYCISLNEMNDTGKQMKY